MTFSAAIEPTEDLELYLGYSRPSGKYAEYADICRKVAAVAPSFDFDRIMTNPDMRILAVRDASRVRALAVLGRGVNRRPVFHLYYADDAATTRALMAEVDKAVNDGFPASNP